MSDPIYHTPNTTRENFCGRIAVEDATLSQFSSFKGRGYCVINLFKNAGAIVVAPLYQVAKAIWAVFMMIISIVTCNGGCNESYKAFFLSLFLAIRDPFLYAIYTARALLGSTLHPGIYFTAANNAYTVHNNLGLEELGKMAHGSDPLLQHNGDQQQQNPSGDAAAAPAFLHVNNNDCSPLTPQNPNVSLHNQMTINQNAWRQQMADRERDAAIIEKDVNLSAL